MRRRGRERRCEREGEGGVYDNQPMCSFCHNCLCTHRQKLGRFPCYNSVPVFRHSSVPSVLLSLSSHLPEPSCMPSTTPASPVRTLEKTVTLYNQVLCHSESNVNGKGN